VQSIASLKRQQLIEVSGKLGIRNGHRYDNDKLARSIRETGVMYVELPGLQLFNTHKQPWVETEPEQL
jgi:hypothetical protein